MEISTSILDASNHIDSILQLNDTNTSYIHIDVMDGQFVPNVAFQDIEQIKEFQRVSKYPLDIHLMVVEPTLYIRKLNHMNIGFITVHLELDLDLHQIIREIHDMGYRAGISIKPNTDIHDLDDYLEEIDLVLVMSVEPGYGGQKFLDGTVMRVLELKRKILENHYSVLIEVDGGINEDTIELLKDVDIAVVGSYIIKSDNYDEKIKFLRNRNRL